MKLILKQLRSFNVSHQFNWIFKIMSDVESYSADTDDLSAGAVRQRTSNETDNASASRRPRLLESSIHLSPQETGNPFHCVPSSFQFASINQLVEKKSTMFFKIAGRLLRITQCKEVGGKTPGYTYSYKQKKEKKAINGSFRLFLFQDLVGTGQVFYVKVHNAVNMFIWNKCLDVRDSGPCSIGSIFVFLGPKPITDVYCNDIFMLQPSGGVILMKEPPREAIPKFFGSVSDSNKTISFNDIAFIELSNMSITACNCVGFFCDRQNLEENAKNGGVCPCYSSGDVRHAKLTICFSMTLNCTKGHSFDVDDYTSHRFSQFFLKTPFPSTSSFNEWDQTEKFMELVTRVNSVIDLVNTSGGWTVIGWAKRGEINDQSVIDESQKIQSTDVKYHLTSIFPYKHDDIDLMKSVEQFKYSNNSE